MENMNKTPHNVKGNIRVTSFCTHKWEKGNMHEDKVMFDQVNSAVIGGVDNFMRQYSVNEEEDIWWRKP